MSDFESTRLNFLARPFIWLMPLVLLACSGNELQPVGPYRAGPQPWTYSAPSGFRANALENGENFLSDLSFTQASNGWGALELDRSNGDKLEADGPILSLNGSKYGKGDGAAELGCALTPSGPLPSRALRGKARAVRCTEVTPPRRAGQPREDRDQALARRATRQGQAGIEPARPWQSLRGELLRNST